MHRVAIFEVPEGSYVLKFIIVGDFIFTLCNSGLFLVYDRQKPSQPKK